MVTGYRSLAAMGSDEPLPFRCRHHGEFSWLIRCLWFHGSMRTNRGQATGDSSKNDSKDAGGASTRRSFLAHSLATLCSAGLVARGSAQQPAARSKPTVDGASIAVAAPDGAPLVPSSSALRVTLLGTGGPELSPERRQGAATLVEADGQSLLFDAGRGVLQRLYDSGAPIDSAKTVFLSHLHSDHIVGLPELWITPWFLSARKGPMHVYGPAGTGEMLAGMRMFLASDVRQRPSPFNLAADLVGVPHEFTGTGVVYRSGGVTVTSVPVDHKEGNPAFGFVIDCGGRKLVLSGDCTLSEPLISAGKGADVVVHNVFAPSPALLARDPNTRKVSEKLASPEQAAEVFRRTGTRHGVYSHVILLDSTEGDVIARTRAAGYAGPLTVGADLTTIHIGETIDIGEINDVVRHA
jgi:ribonuclease Z